MDTLLNLDTYCSIYRYHSTYPIFYQYMDQQYVFPHRLDIEKHIADSDLIIVGEGQVDRSTAVSYTHLTLPTNREV